MEKTIAILGSTGSIGTQTLEVVRENQDIRVAGLSAGSNITLLEKQIREFHPSLAAVWDEEQAKILAGKVRDLDVKVVSGMDGLLQLAQMEESQILVTAIVGMIGIRPTIAAIQAGKDIALANKETLVTAGHLIMPMAKEKGVQILPVDSEHSAIFQAIHGEDKREIHKLLITASGGPFRGMKASDLAHVKVEDALKHPNWAMGQKITIDSATMVNKGLEIIEAKWFFDVPPEQIDVLIQRESLIHSAVEYADGSVIAQMGPSDMRIPIQYALTYPNHRPSPAKPLDLTKLLRLTFGMPRNDVFKGIPLAYRALEHSGSMLTVFNAANEWANQAFRDGLIGFTDIYRIIEAEMDRHDLIASPSVDEILAIENDINGYLNAKYHCHVL